MSAAMRPLAHRRVWLALSVLLLAGVILGSLVPTGRVPHPGVSDKLVHAGAYFFLAIWFGGLTYRSAYGVVLLGLLALGAALEVLQGAMHLGRTADLMDLAANAAGIVAGLTVLRLSGTSWADRVEAWMKA